jgi:hypothetical protein
VNAGRFDSGLRRLLAAQTEQPIAQSSAAGAAEDDQCAEKSERPPKVWMSVDQDPRQSDRQPKRDTNAAIEFPEIQKHGCMLKLLQWKVEINPSRRERLVGLKSASP